MRIAINAALVGERHTGVSTYIVGLVEHLRQMGHQVVVYGNSSQIPTGPGIKIVKTPARLTFDDGSNAARLRFIWNQSIMPFHLLREKVDAVVAQNVDGCFWSPVPQILIIHDLIPLFYPDESPRLHGYYKRVLPSVIKRTAAVIAVSQHTRNNLVRHYKLDPSRVHIAYDGLNSPLASPAFDRKPVGLECERYFLFVGTFAPRKNLETVTRALAKLQKEMPESLVIVAYPDKWMRAFLQRVAELGLSDKVIHLSGLSPEELTYVYRHATALFLLSEYEGFGLPPLEAMLAGTPAVVSDSTALAETVGDAALKIGAHDVDAAAEAMRNLSTDRQFQRGLRQLGAVQANKFTWSNTGATLSSILSEVARKRVKAARAGELSP